MFSCNGNKPKPISDAINKTTVMVNGEKDSVINNPQKNYGNATIGDPCVRCLLRVIQADAFYKKSAAKSNHIKYVINYVKTTQPQDTVSEIKATNALRVDVIDNKNGMTRLSTFIYDNSLGKLYSVNKATKIELITDTNSLMRIRNGCYWGVASAKQRL
ncbi:hypothetical protein A0256_16435 [Mucilaginibacter sp. PAMC 26640]|nr:hypothetical protein A0256_16435 [Mucilaginibacter sp. PAMC 26640]